MRKVRPLAFFCAGLALVVAAAESPDGKRGNRFRMYRNPPKPTLAIMPVQSSKLERPAREIFNKALAKEAVKLPCRLLPFPEQVAIDSFGQLAPGALIELRRKHRLDLVLQSRIEQSGERNTLFAEIIDTRNGSIRAAFKHDCECQLGEFYLWVIPEAVKRLGFSMNMRPPRCPRDMVLIPAPVKAGEPDSTGKAWGPGAYCIDLHEYPNDPGVAPVHDKTYKEAEALCREKGKRLCNEEEWQLACGGWDQLAYPYGSRYDKGLCNTESSTISLSGGHSRCRSPFGVYDLSGNLFEWTSSPWSSKLKDKVVRGGHWQGGEGSSGCADRFAQPQDQASPAIGLRCCSEPLR